MMVVDLARDGGSSTSMVGTKMRPDDLFEFTRKRPFLPYRICATDGRTYDIRHPDQVIVLRSRVVIGVGGSNGTPDHLEHLALIHVVRIEELERKPSEAPD